MIPHSRMPVPTLIALLLTAFLLGFAGCSGKIAKKANPEKVDCDKLCDKTFGTCFDEVLLARGKVNAKKLAVLKRLKILPRIQKKSHAKNLKGCRSKKGQFADAKAVNACIAIKDCKKHAACIIKHVQ